MTMRERFVGELVAICKMAMQSSEVEPVYYHSLIRIVCSICPWSGEKDEGHHVKKPNEHGNGREWGDLVR